LKDKQVIHRDLSARNILIKNDGRASVSDFGLARMKQDQVKKKQIQILVQ
jgi:serine/threonine protein kinase